jgi:hypothetical protein
MKVLSIACLLAASQADYVDNLAEYYKNYQLGLANAVIKAGSNNLSEVDITSTTCYATI